jgi:flagellin-like protein
MVKGISPLVASVILIAVTMTIAGILSFWATSFVHRGLPEGENVTQDINCQGAQFRLYSTCNYHSQTKEIVFVLENQRSIDLNFDKLYVFYPDRLEDHVLPGTLAGNELKRFNVSNIETGFEKLQIRTACSGVFIEFNCSQV